MTKLQTVNRMLSYLAALLLPLLAGCGRAGGPESLEYVNSAGFRNMPEGYAAYAVTSANHIFCIDLRSRSAAYVKSLPPHCVNTAAKLDIVLNRDDDPCLFFASDDEVVRMSPSIWDGRIDVIELRKDRKRILDHQYLDANTISGWLDNPDAPVLFRLLPTEMRLDTGNPGQHQTFLPDALNETGEMDFCGYHIVLNGGKLSVDGAEVDCPTPSMMRTALIWRFPAGLLIMLFSVSVFIFLVVYPFIVKKKGARAFEQFITMRAERERFLVKMSDSVYASVSGSDLMKMYDDICSNLNVDDLTGISARTEQWEKFESMLTEAAGYAGLSDFQCLTESVSETVSELSSVVEECRSARMDKVVELSGRLEAVMSRFSQAVLSDGQELLSLAVKNAGVPVQLSAMLVGTEPDTVSGIVGRFKSILSASTLWQSLSRIGGIVSEVQSLPAQDKLKYLDEEFYKLKSLDAINGLQDRFKEECSLFYLNLGKADEAALEKAGLGARTSFFRNFILLLVFIDYSSRIGIRDIAILANTNIQTVSARKSELVNRKLKDSIWELSGDMSAMAVILKVAYANVTRGKKSSPNSVNDNVNS